MRRDVKYEDSGDESDFDEAYFERTYQPLSNLPTPPMSSKSSSPFQTPQLDVDDESAPATELFGPAVHLVNLLPPAASLATPSVPLVQAILARAKMPMESIALAVCILDSLDSKFARTWRLSCPLASPDNSLAARRYTLPAAPMTFKQSHIDTVRPEVIILSALIIAVKFHQDLEESMRYYALAWGSELWSCEQLNYTEARIMESLDYRIMPLMDRDIIDHAMGDMKRAGKYATAQQRAPALGPEAAHARAMSAGEAVYGLGMLLTPRAETPGAFEGCSLRSDLGEDVQAAFSRPPPSISPESLHLPSSN